MRKVWLLMALGVVLTACSGRTVYRLEVDVLSFVPETDRSDSLSLVQGEARLPDDPAGQLISLPGGEAVEDGRFEAQVQITNTGTLPLEATLEIRLGPAGDNNLYDGTGGDFAWGSGSIQIPTRESGTLLLNLDLTGAALDLVQQGQFRIGARLRIDSGDQMAYEVQALDLTLRLRPFRLIPAP